MCAIEEDCVCADCDADGFCGNPDCNLDGVCEVYLEGCACADCFAVEACLDNPVCGNGEVDGAEQCDGVDLGGSDCAALGFEGGDLACAADCTFDTTACEGAPPLTCVDVEADPSCVDADSELCICQACDPGNGCDITEDCVCPDCFDDAFCSGACELDGVCDPYNEGCQCADCADNPSCEPATCGDGMITGGEQCEAMDLDGQDCLTLGFGGGMLDCAADCTFDTSMCEPPAVACVDVEADDSCTDADPLACVCQGCDAGNGCEISEDCTCPDCAMDGFCTDACQLDGVCDPYNEGCACADCADFPACS
jgi:hypothetical protein